MKFLYYNTIKKQKVYRLPKKSTNKLYSTVSLQENITLDYCKDELSLWLKNIKETNNSVNDIVKLIEEVNIKLDYNKSKRKDEFHNCEDMITNVLWPKNKIYSAILIYIRKQDNQELLLKYHECVSQYI